MDKIDCVVTTTHKPNMDMINCAKSAATEFGMIYVERGKFSLDDIKNNFAVTKILIAGKNGWVLNTQGGEMFFHLNMANLRIKSIVSGQSDHMVKAMELKEGMRVLDCTLGLASDAIVSSFVVGSTGKVCGLEVSPLTAFIVKEGLKNFAPKDKQVEEALRRIEVININYLDFLRKQPENAYDVVYLDPMFRHPIKESLHLNPLRFVADHTAVSLEALIEAKRVAKCRVVFKENSRSKEFERLAFSKIEGGKYSSVHYGVIELNEKR